VIGGPLGASLLKLNGTLGIAGWQWIFLVEGVPAVLLASYGIAALCDRPIEAGWLTAEQRAWLQRRLDVAKFGHGLGLLRSIVNPQMLILTVAYPSLVDFAGGAAGRGGVGKGGWAVSAPAEAAKTSRLKLASKA
jgi:MFS transporter, ACS family, tartrate transporter